VSPVKLPEDISARHKLKCVEGDDAVRSSPRWRLDHLMYIDLKSKLQTAPEMSFHLGSKAEENAVLAAVIDVENQVVQAPAGRAPNRIVTFHNSFPVRFVALISGLYT
jgi:hypothetical protein